MKKLLTKSKLPMVVFLWLMCVPQLFAQRQITGTITDATTGDPLIGATVLVKGTTIGTVSDISGNYTINVSGDDAVLIFSYIGYEDIERAVGENTVINVTLSESATQLEDVVVIGYGTVRKSDLTGSVAVVTPEELNRVPASNFQKALQGRAAGVIVTSNTGKPGSGASIKVRGIGSINRGGDPIYVIDGVIGGNLNAINPADIESLQVLKDASATAIYGSDGANGVVIITTKRGQSGRTNVVYNNWFSVTQIPEKLDLMNADEYAEFYNTVNAAQGVFQPAYTDEFRQWYYGNGWEKGTDWQDEITQTGFGQNHYLRISGGGENNNFSLSGNFYDESGILISNNAARYNLRANSDFQIGNILKVGETFNITRTITENGLGGFGAANIVSPLMKVYNEDNKEGFEGPQIPLEYPGGIINGTDTFRIINNTGGNDKTNPVAQGRIPENFNYSNNFLGNVYAELEPVDWFQYRISASVTGGTFRSKVWTSQYDLGVRSTGQAELSEDFSESFTYQLENQVTLQRQFGMHNLTATAVHQVRMNEGANIQGSANGFPYESLNVFSQALEDGKNLTGGKTTPFRQESYLARVIYDYNSTILFTGSFRRDGVSRFGPENRWGNFPSASIAYKINEDFLQNIQQINMLKLRVGWGRTGNSDIGDFLYEDFLTPPTQFSPVFGDPNKMVTGTYVFYSFSNPLIRWESAEMTNIGLDLNAFNNKVQATIEYYWKNTEDLLVQVPVSIVFGRSGDGSEPFTNLGEIVNRGLEMNLMYKNYDNDFKYSASLNLTTFKNEVLFIPENREISGSNTRTRVGNTIGSLFGYVAEGLVTPNDFDEEDNYLYAEPAEGIPQPGDIRYKDLNNDGLITDLDRTLIGKSLPDFIGGFNFEASWKNFDFSLFLNGMFNYEIFHAQKASLSSFVNQDINHNKLREWTENYYSAENPTTEYVRADPNNTSDNDRISTWWIENGTFVRVRDIQLGYSLPQSVISRVGINRARVYVSTTNPILFTDYTGRDPENAAFTSPLNSGTDNGGYPNPKVYTFGMQIEF